MTKRKNVAALQSATLSIAFETGIRRQVKVLVKTTHTSVYPNPIEFQKGDQLELGQRDTEYPGWIRVRTSNGNEGWAPEQYIMLECEGSGVGEKNYNAHELNTKVGEELVVLSETNGWYWVERRSGEKGWVPVDTTKKA